MKRAALGGVLVLLLASCKRGGTSADEKPKTDTHADESEHQGLPKRVRLTPEVITAAGLKSEKVARTVLPSAIELPGEVSPDPDRSAQVSARMAGRIERVSFQEGALVKAGDVLAIVRAPDAGELSSAAQSLAARASAARSNATRLEGLLASGLAAQQEVIAARSEADALEAEAKAARERASASGAHGSGSVTLTTPIAGTVVARHAVVGQPVTPEETIATIVDLSQAWFLARVFEQNLSQVRIGAAAEVRLNAFPDEPFTGNVDYIASQIDPTARTVVARVRLENRASMLRVGLFGTARIDTGAVSARPPVIVIPRSAIAEIGGKKYAFVQHPDNDFELHELVLGESALGKVEVIAGLREDENVVTAGVFTLKSAVLRASLAEED